MPTPVARTVSLPLSKTHKYPFWFPKRPFSPPERTRAWVKDEPRFPGRTKLPISGPPQFVINVNRVLDDLRTKAPYYFFEVLEYLPQAIYDPIWLTMKFGSNVAGVSEGIFAGDGEDDYDEFLEQILHETAHNVLGHHKRRDQNLVEFEIEAWHYANEIAYAMRRRPIELHDLSYYEQGEGRNSVPGYVFASPSQPDL